MSSASADLAGWAPARRPEPRVLEGRRVRLVPVDPARDAEDLYAAAGGDPELWRYLPYGPFAGPPELRAHYAGVAASRDPLFLSVVDAASDRAGGVVAYLRSEPAHGCVEIGHIWFGAALQRTPAGTEAIFLLLRHAFEELGHRRVEWKCNAANVRSRRAAARLGFVFEGIFRQHMVVKGASRDTAWYSLLDGEWAAAGAAFGAWLAPENFDADGRQRTRLADLRSPPPGHVPASTMS